MLQKVEVKEVQEHKEAGPPALPTDCCNSGCANCVWLDYSEEVVSYYRRQGRGVALEDLLQTVSKNVDDPMVRAFVQMELRGRFKKL